MGRYKVKSKGNVEAIQWTGNIEDVEKEAWCKEQIEKGNLIFAVNSLDDDDAKIIYIDSWDKQARVIEKGDYVVLREGHKDVYGEKQEEFEHKFEPIKETNCVTVDLELNKEEFDKHLKEAKEDLNDTLKLIDKLKDTNGLKVMTKDMFIYNNLIDVDKKTLENRWKEISKGYNFILFRETDDEINRYFSVDYINNLFAR